MIIVNGPLETETIYADTSYFTTIAEPSDTDNTFCFQIGSMSLDIATEVFNLKRLTHRRAVKKFHDCQCKFIIRI